MHKLTAPVITETGTGFDIWSRIQFSAPSFLLVAHEATNYYMMTGILLSEGGERCER